MARALIVGCGCRGRVLGERLLADGWAVRGTSRREEGLDAIREAGVKAIFSERQFPATLVSQLAAETGARVIANLYDDSLGDPPVTSYSALIRWDTDRIVEALA